MSDAVAIAARDLVVGHPRGDFALRVPALDLRRGEVLAVLGPNGAGKSTLLQALAGLLPARSGSLRRAGAGTALVFQRPLLVRGSARWNVEVALWSRGLPRRERRQRAEAALARFAVEALAGRDVATLSGGEARRVALARAFAVEPDALLLDEPFDDLDAEARERLIVDLRRALADSRLAVALVSHDLRHALALADRLAVVCEGRLVQVGPREEVLRRPASARIAPLVGMTNLLAGRIVGRTDAGLVEVALAAGGRLVADAQDATAGAAVIAGVRPEHVKLDVEGGDRGVVGDGRVRELLSDGALLTAWIEWEGALLRTHLLAGRGLGHELKPGAAVRIAIRPEDVHLLPAAAPDGGCAGS